MKLPTQIATSGRLFRTANRLRSLGLLRFGNTSNQSPVTTSLNKFSPTTSNAAQLGFLERGHPSRFAEACSTLNVRQTSEPDSGYGKRSYGAKVIDERGHICWLKVFGLTSHQNERWQSEMDADVITDVPKPHLIRQFTWKHGDEFWVARLTTLVTGIVEEGPWAGISAHSVEDQWLESLTKSLNALALQPCTRVHIQASLFERWLKRHFRKPPKIAATDWVPSHNDLQWSNLSHPTIFFLDWEWYGQSPRGYDLGTLMTCSCHDNELLSRLEDAFKPALSTEISAFGKLFAAHTISNSIRNGWLTPAMKTPVARLINRWESELKWP